MSDSTPASVQIIVGYFIKVETLFGTTINVDEGFSDYGGLTPSGDLVCQLSDGTKASCATHGNHGVINNVNLLKKQIKDAAIGADLYGAKIKGIYQYWGIEGRLIPDINTGIGTAEDVARTMTLCGAETLSVPSDSSQIKTIIHRAVLRNVGESGGIVERATVRFTPSDGGPIDPYATPVTSKEMETLFGRIKQAVLKRVPTLGPAFAKVFGWPVQAATTAINVELIFFYNWYRHMAYYDNSVNCYLKTIEQLLRRAQLLRLACGLTPMTFPGVALKASDASELVKFLSDARGLPDWLADQAFAVLPISVSMRDSARSAYKDVVRKNPVYSAYHGDFLFNDFYTSSCGTKNKSSLVLGSTSGDVTWPSDYYYWVKLVFFDKDFSFATRLLNMVDYSFKECFESGKIGEIIAGQESIKVFGLSDWVNPAGSTYGSDPDITVFRPTSPAFSDTLARVSSYALATYARSNVVKDIVQTVSRFGASVDILEYQMICLLSKYRGFLSYIPNYYSFILLDSKFSESDIKTNRGVVSVTASPTAISTGEVSHVTISRGDRTSGALDVAVSWTSEPLVKDTDYTLKDSAGQELPLYP